ncbi:hypothetical protein V6N13_046092 [Hibiscus sabdariffa]
MGQQSLIYAFVARGTVVLADYTEFTGNFTGIASQCLQKLPASNNKFTYNCDGHTFNYLVDNGFTYCVVAIESVGRQVPMAFLERIKEDFTKRYGGGKAAAAPAQSLSKEFGPKLKEHMQYCIDHPEEISKIAKVKAQVSEVKGVMMENIEKVLDRGEKIELLVDKTENLRSQAQDFRQQGTQMRRKMWLQNMKIKLIVLGILIALILIIYVDVWIHEQEKTLFVRRVGVDLENQQGVFRLERGSSPQSVMASSSEHRRNSSAASSSPSFSVELPVKSARVICVDAEEMYSSRDSQEAAGGDDSRAVVDRSALNNGLAESSGALNSLHELLCVLAIEFEDRTICCTELVAARLRRSAFIYRVEVNIRSILYKFEGTVRRSLSEVGTSPVGTSNIEKMDSSQCELEISKSETQRQRNTLAEVAAQIFDNNIPDQQKHKLLNGIVTVKNDGTVVFEVPEDVEPHSLGGGRKDAYTEVAEEESLDIQDLPPLQIVMLIVGTRGDVQPFIAIGKRLQDYGHRVRLATHSNFKEFVLTAGLEFYPLGGDPKVLAGYMVKNKGFLPSGPSEIPIQRKQIKDIIYSLLPACKDPDPDSGIPFKADAIISNPPAYGHTHVAEALKVPIHIFFTMPWTPTSEFPHPLSRVKQPAGYRLSYQIVDSMIWLGIRDMINDLRKKKLKLRPVTYLSGSHGSDSDVPHGYIWSPHLVPKPKDWGPKIDVVGFCFLDLAKNYEPPASLIQWLEAGPRPIYIGFGSLPVQEPEKMTQIIVKALEQTRQRGIINKGWGGLGELAEPKDFVYLLDNVPHDWLFLQCKAVVHHGGAGTTAAGLKAACPTTIVPFFGDQPFWGEQVHARGVGPPPIPVDEFSLPKLIAAINFMLDPQVKERAIELAKAMENEDGVSGAVKAFFKHLPRNKPGHEPPPAQPSILFSIRRCFGCS